MTWKSSLSSPFPGAKTASMRKPEVGLAGHACTRSQSISNHLPNMLVADMQNEKSVVMGIVRQDMRI
jgi:hypothetical protein